MVDPHLIGLCLFVLAFIFWTQLSRLIVKVLDVVEQKFKGE